MEGATDPSSISENEARLSDAGESVEKVPNCDERQADGVIHAKCGSSIFLAL